MGSRGIHPIDGFRGRQQRMASVQQVSLPLREALRHGAYGDVSSEDTPEEGVTSEGFGQRPLDEQHRIGRRMQPPQEPRVRLIAVDGCQAVEEGQNGVRQGPPMRGPKILATGTPTADRQANPDAEYDTVPHC
jgi:hypothetical protein